MKDWDIKLPREALQRVLVSPKQARLQAAKERKAHRQVQADLARRKFLATHKNPPIKREKGRSRRKRREQRSMFEPIGENR